MEFRPILSTLSRHKTAASLIVLEVALTCAIICNVLFIVAERWDALRETSGVAEHQLVALGLSGVDRTANSDALVREDVAALSAVPGVTSVSTLSQLPFQNGANNGTLSTRAGQSVPTLYDAVYYGGESTLQTLGLRLISGRDFEHEEFMEWSQLLEHFSGAPGAWQQAMPLIISQAAAEKLFPGQPAAGKQIYMGSMPCVIVGVVEHLRRPDVRNGNSTYSVILPVHQSYARGSIYVLRVSNPERREQVLRDAEYAVEHVSPNRLVLIKQTFDERRADYFSNDRNMIGLLIALCAAMLLVTALGIVGLASFWVQQRTRQIGVRRALGATRMQILRYFHTENLLLVGAGIVLGMLLAYSLNQLLMSQYELPRLPLVYLPIGALALFVLGQLAVLWPAHRASTIPPALATRSV